METFRGPDLQRWFGDSARLVQFGAVAAQEIDPLVYQLEREGPTTDGSAVRFHPAYAQAGRPVRTRSAYRCRVRPPYERTAMRLFVSPNTRSR